MATIDATNVKKRYYLRYNSTAGKWEIIYFRTAADVVVETADRKFLSGAEKTAITALQPSYQVILDQLHNNIIKLNSDTEISANTVYYEGDLLIIDNNYLFRIRSTKTFEQGVTLNPEGSDLNATALQSALSTYSIAAEYIGSFPTLSQYVNDINSKVNTSTLFDNTGANAGKIKLGLLPDSILGQMIYGGTISKGKGTLDNDFSITINFSTAAEQILSTKGVTIANHKKVFSAISISDISKYEGMYFIAASGTDETTDPETSISSFDLIWTDANSNTVGYTGEDCFQVGDWLIATNDNWVKIDNTDAVTKVNGRTGLVYIYRGAIQYGANNYTEWPTHKGDIFTYVADGDVETVYVVTDNFTPSTLHLVGDYNEDAAENYLTSSTGADFLEAAASYIKPLGHGPASLTYAGVVQLTNSITSTDESNAATPKAVYNYAQYYKVYESGISSDPGSTNETKALYNAEIDGKEPQSTKQDGTIWLLEKLPVTIS